MRIGLLAYSTDTGLGNQTYEFYKHMKPAKTLVADLSSLNGMETHHDRFPDGKVVQGIPDCNAMQWLVEGVDLIFVCETPLNYCLFEKAKAAGVPVVLQYNYEFLDYLQRPNLIPPAVLAAPSWWNKEDVIARNIAPVVDLTVPVNDERIRPREITVCRKMIHVAGKQAHMDRNGTLAFIQAAEKCGGKFEYVIYAQQLDDRTKRAIERASVDIQLIENLENYEDMYAEGDVLVLPRRYGGLCLPMNEALAAGMPVIMPDISPNDQRLPKQWLVKANKADQFMARTMIDVYSVDPNFLAFKMCEFANETFMRWSNQEAIELGKGISWKQQKAIYDQTFEMIKAQA